MCAVFPHSAKRYPNLLKNNRSPDAHLAAFYPAIRQGCRFPVRKNREFHPVTALRPQNHGAVQRPPNQCADKENFTNRRATVPVCFILPSTYCPELPAFFDPALSLRLSLALQITRGSESRTTTDPLQARQRKAGSRSAPRAPFRKRSGQQYDGVTNPAVPAFRS